MGLIDKGEIAKSVNNVLADFLNSIEASFDMRIALAFRISECYMKAKTVDAVPVVRCKECNWRDDRWCNLHNSGIFAENDFCSYGLRKDGEADDN